MPNIPPLVSHRRDDDFGPNPSGRPLFVNPANVSGGVVGGGVENLVSTNNYLLITLSDLITPASKGDLYVTNNGIVSLAQGVGINISNTSSVIKNVSVSGANTSTTPHVTLLTQTPFLHNAGGTTISYTNFPSQTPVPILQITTASAYNYCEFSYGWNPILPNGDAYPAMASSNDTTAPFHFYLTPSLGIPYTQNTVFNPLVFPNVQNEGTTNLPTALQNAPAIFNSTNIVFPALKMSAWSAVPSSNWYFVGSNSSTDAAPVPYINFQTTNSMSFNMYLWNATLS
jgi:hypothetical protein